MRARIASATTRAVNATSRRLRRGEGTVAGGRAGLRVDPKLLEHLSAGRLVALVSGTNGKTTTTRLLAVALGADGELEVTAAGTQLQVPAQRATAKFAAAGHRDLLADVLAGCVTRVAVSDQGAARLMDERLDLVHRALKDRGDRLMGEVAGLGEQQR